MLIGESKKMNTNYSPPWRGVGVGQYKKLFLPAGKHGIFFELRTLCTDSI